MERNGTLDHARLVAAFGIVFFHVGAPGGALGYAALPFFVILLVTMAAPAAARTGFRAFTRERAKRLLIPWLAWSAVYGGLKLAELLMTGAPAKTEFAPWMIVTGPALHLWFLPFAFAACLLVHPLIRLRASLPGPGGAVLSVLLVLAALAALALGQDAAPPRPFAQWLYTLPAVALGLAIVLCDAMPRGWLLIGAAVFAGCALAAGWTAGLLQLGLAGGALALCRCLPTRATWLSHQAGAAALGVYLTHPLVLSVLDRVTALPSNSLAMALAGGAGALLLTGALSAGQAALQRPAPLPPAGESRTEEGGRAMPPPRQFTPA